MEAYLTRLAGPRAYEEFIAGRIVIGQDLPPSLYRNIKHVKLEQLSLTRYRNGHEMLMSDGLHVFPTVSDNNTRAENLRGPQHEYDRFVNGYLATPNFIPSTVAILEKYRNGFDVGAVGRNIKFQTSDHKWHFAMGGRLNITIDELNDFYVRERFVLGYHMRDVPDYVPDEYVFLIRIGYGYDPEYREHDYKTSYLLGYKLPNNIHLELTDNDRRIHADYELNKTCILALAGEGDLPVMLRDKMADFTYVTGLAAPTTLTFVMAGSGEVLFQTGEDEVLRSKQIRVWQIFDKYRVVNPYWETCLVADLVGTLIVRKMTRGEEWRYGSFGDDHSMKFDERKWREEQKWLEEHRNDGIV